VLMKGGAELMARNNVGIMPLHAASLGGHTAIGRLLLDRGAEIDAKDTSVRPRFAAAHALTRQSVAVCAAMHIRTQSRRAGRGVREWRGRRQVLDGAPQRLPWRPR
jgi:ankyrin repeat protein